MIDVGLASPLWVCPPTHTQVVLGYEEGMHEAAFFRAFEFLRSCTAKVEQSLSTKVVVSPSEAVSGLKAALHACSHLQRPLCLVTSCRLLCLVVPSAISS